jgi:hypothetical protein
VHLKSNASNSFIRSFSQSFIRSVEFDKIFGTQINSRIIIMKESVVSLPELTSPGVRLKSTRMITRL